MKKVLSVALALVMCLGLFSACSQDESQSQSQSQAEVGVTFAIAGLKGPTTMGMVKLMDDAEKNNADIAYTGNKYNVSMYGTANEVMPLLIQGQLDVALILHDLKILTRRQENGKQPAAVKRRDRDEVEHRKPQIEQNDHLENIRKALEPERIPERVLQVQADLEQDHRQIGQEQVGKRACRGRKSHPLFGVFKIPGVDRHRLCPAEARHQHQHRAERVQMLKRVQGKPALIPGGGVPYFIGCPGMGKLMERQGGEQHHQPDRRLVKQINDVV